jgi:hypothetical protein
MVLVDINWWLSRLGVGDEGSSWSRGLNEVIIIDLSLLLLLHIYLLVCCTFRSSHYWLNAESAMKHYLGFDSYFILGHGFFSSTRF